MKKKKKIYEGKAKKLYADGESENLILDFMDEATVYDGQKREAAKNKGVVNNQISSFIFSYLEGFNIPTHFIKEIGPREMLIKNLEMIKIEVIMRNVAAGSFAKKYGLEEGRELSSPILEFYLKDEARHVPMINHSHIQAFGLATADEVRMIERIMSKINAVLKSLFQRRLIKLVDFKVEFGRSNGKILLGDEISPDTCRFWDISSAEKIDKEKFRFDSGDVAQKYEAIKNRILT